MKHSKLSYHMHILLMNFSILNVSFVAFPGVGKCVMRCTIDLCELFMGMIIFTNMLDE